MQAPVTTSRTSPIWRRLLMPALCTVSVMMLAAAAPAQDSDDDGVLPSGSSSDQHGGGGSSSSSSASTTVGTTAAMDDDVLDPEQASIALSSIVGDTVLATEVESEDATFVADTEGLTIQQTPTEVSIQGSGGLLMHGNLSAGFQAPDESAYGTFVLILDDGMDSLDDVKNGLTQPKFVAVLGDLPSFDLNFFFALVMYHAPNLPGLSVTLVHVSVDDESELHTSAVRLSTSGGPIEVVTE